MVEKDKRGEEREKMNKKERNEQWKMKKKKSGTKDTLDCY
jgi:hypothetical protein